MRAAHARGRSAPLGLAVSIVVALAACTSTTTSSPPAPTSATGPGTSVTTPVTQGRTSGSAQPDGSTPDPAGTRNPTLGIGDDESFPNLGSNGFDVTNYDLDLTYDPDTNDLAGVATIDARANTVLDDVVLDLDRLDVAKATVDGGHATFEVQDRKLHVHPADRLARGATFTVGVVYAGKPRPRASDGVFGVEVGWHGGNGGSFVVSEPEGASTWYPVNNHPRDKATYSMAITVPKPYVAIGNGERTSVDEHDDSRTFHWRMDRPMASYLASVVTGTLHEHELGTTEGVAYSTWTLEQNDLPVMDGRDQVRALSDKLGPFPFATYGGVVYSPSWIQGDATTQEFLGGVALEVQGRSLYAQPSVSPETVLHETAHQWMGDNVSVTDWSKDIWWVEGFARFAENALDESVEERRPQYEEARRTCRNRQAGDLPKSGLFDVGSYTCGSLVFYALELEVGDDTFWKILRTFNERYRYSNASTEELIATASDVAGRDLSDFFHAWLFGPLPDLPG